MDFLELVHVTHLDEICLMILFRGGLSEPLSSIMSLHDPNWTLQCSSGHGACLTKVTTMSSDFFLFFILLLFFIFLFLYFNVLFVFFSLHVLICIFVIVAFLCTYVYMYIYIFDLYLSVFLRSTVSV